MSTTAANANASAAASPTSYDVLAELDRLLDATPHGSHVCKPLKRAVVAAAAAEIRRLRVQVAMRRDPFEHAFPDAIRNDLAAMENDR